MNKVILIGRLTKDPEVRYTTNENKMVCTFNIAVPKTHKKDSKADFFKVVAWEKLAEICSNYLEKGRKITVEGKINIRYWEDENGIKRQSVEVVGKSIYFVESKKAS